MLERLQGTKGQYKLHRILDLSICSVSEIQLEDFPNRPFVVESPQKTFVVIAQTQRQRDDWVNDLSQAIMVRTRGVMDTAVALVAGCNNTDRIVFPCRNLERTLLVALARRRIRTR